MLTVVSEHRINITQASESAPHDLENEHGDPPPPFFPLLAKVDPYLSAWQVRGNVVGTNFLKRLLEELDLDHP